MNKREFLEKCTAESILKLIVSLPTIDIVHCEECRWIDDCSQTVANFEMTVDTALRWCSDGERSREMILHSQQIFDKAYIDMYDSSGFMEYVSGGVERELGTKVMDKLKDHKLYAVKLHEPEIREDLPWYWSNQCSYRQNLQCMEIVQCKDCRMVYPWCQKFRDELGGDGFCPYGKPAEVLYIDKE